MSCADVNQVTLTFWFATQSLHEVEQATQATIPHMKEGTRGFSFELKNDTL